MKPYTLMLAAVVVAGTLAGCASEKSCPGWPQDQKTTTTPAADLNDAGVHGPASGS